MPKRKPLEIKKKILSILQKEKALSVKKLERNMEIFVELVMKKQEKRNSVLTVKNLQN